MKITLQSIPHETQRYKTVGDWFQHEPGEIHITASKLSDWRREYLILVHELVEWGLCRQAAVSQKKVDEFDKLHENEQVLVDIGDLKEAPYRKQHCLATAVERMLAAELGVVWSEYEEELRKLME